MTRPLPFARLTPSHLITTPTPTSLALFSLSTGALSFSYTLAVAPISAAEEKVRKEKEEAEKRKKERIEAKRVEEEEKARKEGREVKVVKTEGKKKASGETMEKKRREEMRYITALEASEDGRWVGVSCSDKQVFVFNVAESGDVVLALRTTAAKRPSNLFFLPRTLLYADKFGDVHSLPLPSAPYSTPTTPEPTLLLGHVSMLLALSSNTLSSSPKKRVILTADRDEHIRVSRYPQAHVIEGFCLGHTGFVAALCVPGGRPGLLVSGSGDGTMRVWEWEGGRCLQVVEVGREAGVEGVVNVMQIVESEGWVAVLVDKLAGFLVYKLNSSGDEDTAMSNDGDSAANLLTFHAKISLPFPPLSLTISGSKVYCTLMPHAEAVRLNVALPDTTTTTVAPASEAEVQHILAIDLKTGSPSSEKAIAGVEEYMRALGPQTEDEGQWAELTRAEMLRKFESEERKAAGPAEE